MKRFIPVLILATLLATSSSTDTIAQEGNKGQLWFCWEATVHPDMASQFVDLQIDFQSKFKEVEFPYTFYTWTDGRFGYYFFYPVDNYEDRSGIYSALRTVTPVWGEDNFKRMWEMLQSHRTYFLRSLPEISYTPENQRLDDSDMPYAFWDILYVKPGNEGEFEEVMKKLFALQQVHSFDDPILMLSGDIGYEGSVYIGALKGKDVIDFRTQNKKMWELFGEEGSTLFKHMSSLLSKREFKEFWYMEKLSYLPD